MAKLWLCCIFAIFLCHHYVDAHLFNMSEYLRMPPMHKFDDYDECFLQIPDGAKATYCVVTSLIKPNGSSPIWKLLHKYSSDHKRMFRHDRLTRGICMDWCHKKMKSFSHRTRMSYYIENFENDSSIYQDPNLFTNALIDRAHYYRYATQCVNYELKKQFGLVAQTQVRYCVTNKDNAQDKYDELDYSFVAICALIGVFVIISTSYDFHLKRNNLPHLCNREHYKQRVEGNKMTNWLLAFSLPRNWYKLTMETKNSEMTRDLRLINCFRTISMFGVVLGHCALVNSMSPLLNPYSIEEKYFVSAHMIIINGSNVLQSFFAITGFLIAIQFMDLREKSKFTFSFYWMVPLKAIFYRYLRCTPVYAFVLLFNATLLYKFRDGPIWPALADLERTTCRTNWWTNLLNINNFVKVSEPCMQHGWYLAADFQLVIFGTIIQLIIWRFSKWTKQIMGTVFAISFLIPAIITYQNRFEGIFMAIPEATRYAHWYDEQYRKIYIPFYTNMGSFTFGMIAGLLYCKHKQGDIDLTKSKLFPVLWHSLVPIAFIGLYTGAIFFSNNFEKPAIWIALYAAFMKILWGVFAGICVLGSAFNTGWILKKFARLHIFRTMGRLTFCAYLIHPTVIRFMYGSMRSPIWTDEFRMFTTGVTVYSVSYLLSIIVCVTIEMPFSIIQKLIFDRDESSPREKTSTIYETTEAEAIKLSKKVAECEAGLDKSTIALS